MLCVYCTLCAHDELLTQPGILSGMFVCAIPPLITDRLSEECQENRELIQPAAYRSPLTVKIDLK